MTFPYTRWEPLSVAEVAALFCVRIEVQLLYKAKGNRAKDQHSIAGGYTEKR